MIECRYGISPVNYPDPDPEDQTFIAVVIFSVIFMAFKTPLKHNSFM